MRYVYFDPNVLRKYAPKAGKLPPSEGAASHTVGQDDDDDEPEDLDLSNLAPEELYKYYLEYVQPIACCAYYFFNKEVPTRDLKERLYSLFDYMYRNGDAFMPFTPMTSEGKSDAKAKSFDGPMTYDQFIALVQTSLKSDDLTDMLNCADKDLQILENWADRFGSVAAALNAASKATSGRGDPDDSDKDSNKSVASKGSRNGPPPNPPRNNRSRSAHSGDNKRSAKEESAGKFYNDNKEDKVTFDVWYYQIKTKFEVNADHFGNDRQKFGYITNRLVGKAAQALLPYLDSDHPDRLTTSDDLAYEKALAEFNDLEMKYDSAPAPKATVKTPAFERPTPEEMRELAREGCCFSCYKKGYMSSECPYKEKLAKCLDAYLNSIADAIWGKDSSNVKELLDAPSSNDESTPSDDKDALGSVEGN
ncbi:hypothetical protein NEUTE2DRAFT_133697 [Neurospora tetrasperma FGSC 2509]|nr:hypothetical protein NEUTE2DRAFT_133697 [Neurospora tetrasperma FGSC 2509]